MYKHLYSEFLKAQQGVQHYASHSHHYWPDITKEATLDYWLDSAKHVDNKWNYFFTEKIPQTQKLICEILNLSHPEQIIFAPNTHELVYRLISALNYHKKIKVLTTDSEFYSFERQITKLEQENKVHVDRVPTASTNFESHFIEKIESDNYDLIFFSQVFFNSGKSVSNLNKIVSSVKNKDTVICIDGYHGFMALPINLSAIEDRVFYVTGSYKYAQGGEGCCFMHVPKNCKLEPLYTGWFAEINHLANRNFKIQYSDDGNRFAGSTMDFTALYRLHAVLKLFKDQNITVEKIHQHVQKLQKNFIQQIRQLNHSYLKLENMIVDDLVHLSNHGHFITFQMPSTEICELIKSQLKKANIIVDSRGDKLRFGFGLYQDEFVKFDQFN